MKEVATKKILETLKSIRKQRGLTQENLAHVIGVERSTYVRKEAGAIPVTLQEFLKIAGFLGVDYDIITGKLEFRQILPRDIIQLSQMLEGLQDEERKYIVKNTKELIRYTKNAR